MTESEKTERDKLVAEVRARVEMERAFGADVYRVGGAAASSPSERARRKAALLAEMCLRIESCRNCCLGATRTKLVFGTGAADARLMFVGEAPGADEDLAGEPFVGRCGQLLTRMIGAMGLDRSQVYIGNILKCRPPENRTPSVEEMAVCLPHILEQIGIIQPEIICALGGIALKGLLRDPTLSITRMRGSFLDWNGIKLMPTFHPSYVLRAARNRRPVWEDLQTMMKELGLPPRKEGTDPRGPSAFATGP